MNPFLEASRDRQENFEIMEQNHLLCWPHFHQSMEILLVLEGTGDISIKGSTECLSTGDVAISDSYDVHAYHQISQTARTSILLIPYRYLGSFVKFKQNCSLSSNFVKQSPIFSEIVENLKQFRSDRASLFLQGLINVILGLILQEIPLSLHRQTKDTELLQDLLLYLQQHYAEQLSLEDIAQHFNYSKGHFSKLFHTYFRCNLNMYLNKLRIENIIVELQNNPDISLNRLIYEKGFTNAQTFYRTFKQLYHMTPNDYLKSGEGIPPLPSDFR